MSRFFTSLSCLCFSIALLAQNPQDAVVSLQLSAGLNPPAVFLNWDNPQPSDITLLRRVKDEPGNTWVQLLSANETLLNGHFDLGLDGNLSYEYAIERKTGAITASGFAYANFFTPVVDQRGKILVFIDSTTADELGADLIRFKNDLRGEGWQPVPFKTGPFTTVAWVKSQIQAAYNADPMQVKAVLLMGSVPVPYSGSMAWDGKSDHVGAWPCDAYYGDVDGIWTDQTVNLPNTARSANRNIPGDGKFDQNTLPSAVELPVGRLDFSRLSAATFGDTPVELLRKYLWKNHLWRSGLYKVPYSALVDDHLGWSGGEAFAANGYRNAVPLVGAGNVVEGAFIGTQRHLLGFGGATNGTYSGAGGIGNALDFATDSVQVVFAQLYGDYFGDWDFETNPLLPAVLASKGGVLATAWVGRPHWMLQGLATGETLGFCLRETQNAQFNTAYTGGLGESGAHLALLGDPTLRATIVTPPTNVSAVSNCTKVNLHWTASKDPEVLGYLVYRSFEQDGPYERLSPNLVFQTSWEDLAPVPGTLYYSVRAVKLEVRPGGGAFYNSSTGPPKTVVFEPGTGPTALGLGGTINCNTPSITLGANFQPPTSTFEWYRPNGEPLGGFIATEGGVYTVIVTAPNGCTAAAFATVYQDTLLPQPDLPPFFQLNCAAPTAMFTVPDAPSGVQYQWNGTAVLPGQVVTINGPAVFTVSSSNNGCTKDYDLQVQTDFDPPGASISHSGLVLDCLNPSVQLLGSSASSMVSYAWTGDSGEISFEQNLLVTSAGNYCLAITATNGCTSTTCAQVTAQGGIGPTLDITFDGDPCAAGDRGVMVEVSGGLAPYQYLWSTGETTQQKLVEEGFVGLLAVTVTDANNCSSAISVSLAAALNVLALTKKETSPGAADGSIDLLLLGGQAPFSFLWSNGETTEDLAGLSNGTYTVTVTGADGCSSVLVVPLLHLGAETALSGTTVQVAPNPAGAAFGVYMSGAGGPAERRLWLCDGLGRPVAAQSGRETAYFFETASLPSGAYVLWVEQEGERVAIRVVVSHAR